MRKLNVGILFGGMSPEHAVSLRSAESVLNHLDTEKYHIYPIGITRDGRWYHYKNTDYSKLPDGSWEQDSDNQSVAVSPVRGQGMLCFEGATVTEVQLDVVFPVLHGENGEDGAIQGLMQLAGVACVGPNLAASAVSMDKSLTKLVVDQIGQKQADWELIHREELYRHTEAVLSKLQQRFAFPMFVKPAGTGSSVGVSKATDGLSLQKALLAAADFDEKILVEEFICGKEVEVAVMGNSSPIASVCGEIDSGADFYDYDAKYVTDTSVAYVPARIDDVVSEQVRDAAVKIYCALGCRGLSRVDFFVTADGKAVFNEINTLPGFTSISMYPKLFEASGVEYADLLDRLLALAMEANQ